MRWRDPRQSSPAGRARSAFLTQLFLGHDPWWETGGRPSVTGRVRLRSPKVELPGWPISRSGDQPVEESHTDLAALAERDTDAHAMVIRAGRYRLRVAQQSEDPGTVVNIDLTSDRTP